MKLTCDIVSDIAVYDVSEKINVSSILIIHHDNNFGSTFIKLLSLIKLPIIDNDVKVSKTDISKLINELSFGMYCIFNYQRGFSIDGVEGRKEFLVEYLRIPPENVLINDETINFMRSDDCGTNGECHYISNVSLPSF